MVEKIKFNLNIDDKDVFILKTFETRQRHEIHTLSIYVNKDRVYYAVHNIEL